MERSQMNPLSIYQEALDAVSQATLAGDFAAYLARMDLPYLMVTARADFVLRRPEELKPTFRNVHDALRRHGATHYERVARSASFSRSDRIDGVHFTHVIANGERIVAPWAARQALVRRADGWKFTEAHYPFDIDDLPLTEADLRAATLPDEAAGAAMGNFAAAFPASQAPAETEARP